MSSRPVVREDEWVCVNSCCQNVNPARRRSCHHCGQSKPRSKGQVGHEIGKEAAEKSKGLFSAEDWSCSKCGNINWARRSQCNVCNASKVGEVEVRTGYGGGFMDRQEVERRNSESDEEYDHFGRLKKKPTRYSDDSNSKSFPEKRYKEEESKEEEDDDESDDESDDDDLEKYNFDLEFGDKSRKEDGRSYTNSFSHEASVDKSKSVTRSRSTSELSAQSKTSDNSAEYSEHSAQSNSSSSFATSASDAHSDSHSSAATSASDASASSISSRSSGSYSVEEPVPSKRRR